MKKNGKLKERELPKDMVTLIQKYPKMIDYAKLLVDYDIDFKFVLNNPLLLKTKKNSERFHWDYKLSENELEELIEKNKYLNWEHICNFQQLSIPFMEKYLKFLDRRICFCQVLTFDFIEKNIDASFIDWVGIAQYQLEEQELEYFDKYLNWNFVFQRENLSMDFKQKHIHKSSRFMLDSIGNIIER